MWWRALVLYLHLTAAVFWVGEMLLLAAVIGPYSRDLAPAARAELFRAIGNRSRPFAWAAVAVLVGTGLLNLVLMGIPLGDLIRPAFYRTPFGLTLGLKLLAVILLLGLTAWHDLWLAARAARLRRLARERGEDPQVAAQAERVRRTASWVGRASLILALLVLFLAARLVALT